MALIKQSSYTFEVIHKTYKNLSNVDSRVNIFHIEYAL
jgi:hypothetical protein